MTRDYKMVQSCLLSLSRGLMMTFTCEMLYSLYKLNFKILI